MLNEQMKKDNNKLIDEQSSNPNRQKILFLVFCAVIALVFIVLYSLLMPKQEEEKEVAQKATFKASQKKFEIEDKIEEKKEKEEYVELVPKDTIPEEKAPEPKPEPKKIPKIIKSSKVVGTAANIENDALNLVAQLKSSQEARQREEQNKNLENMGEVYSPSAAYFSSFDQNLLLAKGTYIGCSLKTKLISDLAGGIACVISNDVYSNNGKTLLIEKGSLVTGSYKGGSVKEGVERIYVIWQEIRTPNNVIIPVYSGASDELGASGASGEVDNHYLKRFGLAILVSMINDSSKALTENLNRRRDDSNNNINVTTADKASDMATKVLEKMMDISPTLYKNQGDIIGIYVNRDIDFSNVYELKKRR